MEMAKLEKRETEQRRSYVLRGRNCPSRGVNRTGIPTQLKEHIEKSTGLSLDDVRVHYNSVQPAKLGALAYAQGNRVEIGPGQERHLPHELGHVIQQKLGVVRANAMHPSGVALNTDAGLERQADEIGAGNRNVIVQRMGVVGHFSLPVQLQPITPKNLYAYGNASAPRDARNKDFGFDDNDEDPEIVVSNPTKGASTWDNPYRADLSGIYHELAANTDLGSKGLAVHEDTTPVGHHTIYPKQVPMKIKEFNDKFKSLGWRRIRKNDETDMRLRQEAGR